MEIVEENTQRILGCKNKLSEISTLLKEEFVGLDQVIDEVLGLITPWYYFPEIQLRPTVICLWGMTGSGKTALVNKLVELLDLQNVFARFDMGEYDAGHGSWFKDVFIDDLQSFNQNPVIICMDEFQFARTIDQDGKELGRDKLRVVWDLIDHGKISYTSWISSFYMQKAEECLKLLIKCKNEGVEITGGVVSAGINEFKSIFNEFYFEEEERKGAALDENYFQSADFIEGLYNFYPGGSFTRSKLKSLIIEFDLSKLSAFLISGFKKKRPTETIDLSKSLVFILGNLDEAYYMSNSLNPDISADEFYEATGKINISTIKVALKSRFRNEQIARLGNNHVLYRSFSNAHFREIIRRKLNTLSRSVYTRFGYSIHFDSSVHDIIYNEGVFPAQGTRPLFTTIQNLVDSYMSKIVAEILIQKLNVGIVKWYFQDDKYTFKFINPEGNLVHTTEENLVLKTENRRKSYNPQIQAHTAVHESGHAVAAALLLRIIPSLIVSRTASSQAEGFCLVNLPDGPLTKDLLRKEICIGLAGYVAEKMIFGEENTSSGVSSDIENVTELAARAIKEYGMGNDPILVRLESSGDELSMRQNNLQSDMIYKLIKHCEGEVYEVLNRNRYLLLQMSQHLTYHSRMAETDILEMVCRFADESWVNPGAFSKKDNYFRFADVIQEQLQLNNSKVQSGVI